MEFQHWECFSNLEAHHQSEVAGDLESVAL